MDLSAGSFQFKMSPRRAVDNEDWVRVYVETSAGAFHGEFEAYLQLEDLRRFGQELDSMYDSPGDPKSASLGSAEPNILIELSAEPLGAIAGSFRFSGEQGDFAELRGDFRIDQSFLPAMRSGLTSLITELSGTNEA